MDDFLSWAGWTGLSALAQIVALATLIGAGWRFILQRRQIPQFVPDCLVIGTAKINGLPYHVVEFRNVGRGPVELRMLEVFEGRIYFEETYYPPGIWGAGQSFRLLLTAPKLSEVWIRITHRTPDDRRAAKIAWYPLVRGDLRTRWRDDVKQWGWGARFRQHVAPKAIGPGGALRGVFHGRRRHDVTVYWGDYLKQAKIYSLGTLHNFAPTDLSYVPAPEDSK